MFLLVDQKSQKVYCGLSPECSSECWDATEEGEGDDDEEEEEKGWHVVARTSTLA